MTTILYLVLAVLLLAVVYFAFQLLLAKPFAIRQKQKEVDLVGGLVKLILWEANEGIVLLKNKQVSDVIYGASILRQSPDYAYVWTLGFALWILAFTRISWSFPAALVLLAFAVILRLVGVGRRST